MKTLSTALLLFALTVAQVQADIAVVVSAGSEVSSLSRSELINIFMGRYRRLPNGDTAYPVDLEPLKSRFYRQLLGKDLAEINSYWARLMFSGQASPPVQVRDQAEMVAYVRRNPGALGFVDANEVPDDLRVVLVLAEASSP